MNIVIEGSQNLRINSLADLSKILPNSFDCQTLNYGQGEGQIQIGSTVWGIYVGANGLYYLQYEEGLCEWPLFQSITAALLEQLALEFGPGLRFKIEGKVEHYQPHEKYT